MKTLQDRYDFLGRFWIPDNPDGAVPGRLHYSDPDTGIRLDLDGELPDYAYRDLPRRRPDPEVINGSLANGREVTLLDLVGRQFGAYGGEAPKPFARYYVNKLVAGKRYASADDIRFGAASMRFSRLDDWLQAHPIETHDEPSGGITATYTPPEALILDLPSISAKLRFNWGFSFDTGGTNTTLEATPRAVVVPEEPQCYSWFLDVFSALRQFLTLAVGTRVDPLEFMGETGEFEKFIAPGGTIENSTVLQWVHVLYVTRSSGVQKRDRGVYPVIVPATEIGALEIALQSWFQQRETLQPSVDLLDVTHIRGSVRVAFLELVQAVESFHRRTESGRMLGESDYQRVCEAAIRSIPEDITDAAFRAAFRGKLTYANEISLRTRLKRIVASLSDASRKRLARLPADWVNRVVDTRNYLTHYSEELAARNMSQTDLHGINAALKFILTVLLLRHVGVDEDMVATRITRLDEYRGLGRL